MKQVVYGNIIYRRLVLKELMFLSFINFLVVNVTYLFVSIRFSLPLYSYVVYLVTYFFILFMIKQQRASKEYAIFDEEGIQIYQYTKHFYRDLLKGRQPKVLTFHYAQLLECSLSYRKANNRSTSRYHLVLHLMKEDIAYDLDINPTALSSKNMNWLLLMLSVKAAVFNDTHQLSLCLMQQHLSLDSYIQRQEAKNL